jgi:hypothetical protein
MNKKHRVIAVLALLPNVLFSTHAEDGAGAEDPFWKALTGGKVNLTMRYRYETVDDDFAPGGVPLKDADASTLRTVLGYRTATFRDFEAYLQVENVTEVGADDYNDGSNGKTQYATVADPTGTEVLDGYLAFTGLPGTRVRAGRQLITYRPDPFHRFIGPVIWRQKWQTYDAVTVQNESLPDTRISYAYVWNVNRIFGEDAPNPLDDFESDSHFMNVQYEGFALGKLQAYAYLLDFDNAAAFSTQTYGVRLDGKYPMTPNTTALYTAEYAYQTDYADNPADIDAAYIVGELGASVKTGWVVDSVTVKLSYELQEGDGGADRFVTILGTNHPFQGWADRFLVTPPTARNSWRYTTIFRRTAAATTSGTNWTCC